MNSDLRLVFGVSVSTDDRELLDRIVRRLADIPNRHIAEGAITQADQVELVDYGWQVEIQVGDEWTCYDEWKEVIEEGYVEVVQEG